MAPPMRILMLHNRYAQPGGEDVSTRIEAAMLRSAGHDLDLWEMSNDGIAGQNMAAVAANALWSFPSTRELGRRLSGKRYDLMHVQNYFPQFSPAVHRVAARHGVPSIQHLRNFRQICVDASLFRDGRICHDCIGAVIPWHGIQHKCYRDSRAGSAVVAAMIGVHKLAGTWTRSVTRYIADSEYVRDLHVRAGLPPDKIAVRANLAGAGIRISAGPRANVFIASRLTPEKGVQVAIEAWRMAPRSGQLRIAGMGPHERQLRDLAAGDPSIVFLGQITSPEVAQEMAKARAVIVPSLWAEPFGRTAVEAMAVGTPVFASATGGLPEILGQNSTGLFPPGDAEALSSRFSAVLADDGFGKDLASEQTARFSHRFSSAALLQRTEVIYAEAIAAARPQPQASRA